MSIRPYTPTDEAALLEILRLNTPKFFDTSEIQDFKDYLAHHIEAYFVAEESGQVVGAGGINYGFDEGKTARLSWDFIHPEYQGKGIGKLLTHFRIQHLAAHTEVNTIEVRTTQLAYSFYGKMGFSLIYMEKDFWAKGFDLYQMRMGL